MKGSIFPDLYPLPFTDEVIAHLVSRIQQVQEYLGRSLILENVFQLCHFQSFGNDGVGVSESGY